MTNPTIYYAAHMHDWAKNKNWQPYWTERVAENLHGKSVIKYLFDKGAIAIAFDDIHCWNPESYTLPQGRSAIKYMNALDEGSDAWVFARYNIEGESRVLVGRPKRNSKCFLGEHLFGVGDRSLPIKLLFLEKKYWEVAESDFPLVFRLGPPFATLVKWNSVQKTAISFVTKKPLDLSDPGSYLPWAIEVLCEEYLRLKGHLNRKIYKCGGTLKDFDIVGLNSNGQPVFAQIKNTSRPQDLAPFENLPEGSCQYYFQVSPKFRKKPHPRGSIIFFDIKEVLETLCGTEGGSEYLKILANGGV